MAKANPNSKAARRDIFRPPEEPVQVECLHCGATYSSSEMRWEFRRGWGAGRAIWWCKDTNCDGAGFEFDICPVAETKPA